MELRVKTQQNRQVLDITDEVQEQVSPEAKALHIFVAHTTCALSTADLDPGAGEDLAAALWEMIPKLDYKRHHDPAHFPSHIGHSLVGPSITIPVERGKLVLGGWQRVVLIELDGPRERKIIVTNL